MEENLVGYLLHSLDPDTHRQVEEYLLDHPEARGRLELLRRALDPLAADADDAPPPGLWVRTLAHVARHQCRQPEVVQSAPPRPSPNRVLPRAPWPRPAQGAGAARSLLRRADVLVAAVLLLVVGGVALTWVGRSWYNQHVYACQNNLRQLHQALWAYSDQHDGEFPRVEAQPPRNVAGIFAPALNDSGVLPANFPLADRKS